MDHDKPRDGQTQPQEQTIGQIIGQTRKQRKEQTKQQTKGGRHSSAIEEERSQPSVIFEDRAHAALQLVNRLGDLRREKLGYRPLVLGVPRGAVPMAQIIADELEGDFDIVLVHKIGHPHQPEFAIGSVTEEGDIFSGEDMRTDELAFDDIQESALLEINRLQTRRRLYTPGRRPIDPKGRTVVVVDDGIATGATLTAAVRALKGKGAGRIVIAAPVASPRAVPRLAEEGAEVRVLLVPETFYAVGQFYDKFEPIEDRDVIRALHMSRAQDRAEALCRDDVPSWREAEPACGGSSPEREKYKV